MVFFFGQIVFVLLYNVIWMQNFHLAFVKADAPATAVNYLN